MAIIVDACGRSCPEPVVMTKKAIGQGGKQLTVLVDNKTALQNVTRFAENAGFTVKSAQEGEVYRLSLQK